MIELDEVLEIHAILIDKFGGTQGIRDVSLIKSAISRPYQTFDGKDLYPDPKDKAAAILESIVKNHPFLDGNKRTGYVLARLLLLQGGLDFRATQEEKYKLVIEVSKGSLNFDQIKDWIASHT